MKNTDNYCIHYPELNTTLRCKVITSNRRNISLQITSEKEIIIKVPKWLPEYSLNSFIAQKRDWIIETYDSIPNPVKLSIQEQHQLEALEKRYRKAAKEYIPARVAYYQQFTGGHYEKIVIRDQKTRWGSCSSNNTLSFNYRLMLAPPHILDYVVVHELCHLKHMNHSPEFWTAVESVLPDYKERRRWLKDHGKELSLRPYITQQSQ